jgi:Protein of unknown function (DUF2752)
MNQQPSARRRLGWRTRVLLLIVAAGLAGLLGLARTLVPDPRGFGTHLQLGLQPCTFVTMTGRLCPTCGMTTAFAWVTRGRVDRSWGANPAGCIFALLSIPLMAWFVVSAVRDEPVGFRSVSGPMMGLLTAGVVFCLASWLVRLIVSPAVLAGPGPGPGGVARSIGL